MQKVSVTIILVLFVKIALSQEFTLQTQYEEYFTKNISTLDDIEGFWIDDNNNTYSIKKTPSFTGILKDKLRRSWSDKNYFDSIMNSNSMLFYEFVLIQEGVTKRNSLNGLTHVTGTSIYFIFNYISRNIELKASGTLKGNDLFLLFFENNDVVLRKIYPLEINSQLKSNDDLGKDTWLNKIKKIFSDFNFNKYKEVILAILTLSFIWAIFFATKKIQRKLKTKDVPEQIIITDKVEYIDFNELLIEDKTSVVPVPIVDKPIEIQKKIKIINPELYIASIWLRFFNLLVDFFIINTVFAYFIGYAFGYFGLKDFISAHPYLFSISLIFSSYFIQEYFFGKTIGKLFTGTRVVDNDGNKPPAWSIIIRTASRLIPFEALSFLSSDKRGWHDTISDTFVIKD